jgi:hypothetical protein
LKAKAHNSRRRLAVRCALRSSAAL